MRRLTLIVSDEVDGKPVVARNEIDIKLLENSKTPGHLLSIEYGFLIMALENEIRNRRKP